MLERVVSIRWAILLTLTASCGGSVSKPDGGPPDGGLMVDGRSPPQAACIVAVHANICCGQPVAVTEQAVQSDPCLVPYRDAFAPEVLARCQPPMQCATVDCAVGPFPSRMVAPDPASPGNCVFVNECNGAEDCTIAIDFSYCCSCPSVFPKALSLANPCDAGVPSSVGPGCPDCTGVRCAACPAIAPVPSCYSNNGRPRVCR